MVHRAVKNTSFDSQPGQRIGGKYHIEAFLGGGLQGEVYRVLELHTRVRRAAKLFFPQQNHGGRAARNYAQRLDRLRDCPIVVQYHHAEEVRINGIDVTCLLSEYVDCILLYDFIARHTGSHLPAFKALHVLYAEHRRDDIIDVVRLLYTMVGDRSRYARQPPAIKAICRGMRPSLILEAFPTAAHLRRRLETFPELSVV
jgi:hypothetical protein